MISNTSNLIVMVTNNTYVAANDENRNSSDEYSEPQPELEPYPYPEPYYDEPCDAAGSNCEDSYYSGVG